MDDRTVADLVEFARIELDSHDLEPWAELLAWMRTSNIFDPETAAWAVKLYNAYDDLGSAMGVLARWPSPAAWWAAPDRHAAAEWPCTQERRNLRGGRINRHLDSYATHLGGGPQYGWLNAALRHDTPAADFDRVVRWTREIWGTGRQSAFEWAEFAGKSLGLPISAGHGWLWESEGPRRSIQALYGNPTPTRQWLDDQAADLRNHLTSEGVHLDWWDFETVICDFHVMRAGRYYPGRHLAALAEEIETMPDTTVRDHIWDAWHDVIPPYAASITPGINKALLPIYRDTKQIICGWT